MEVLDRARPEAPARGATLVVDAVVFDMGGTLLDTDALYRQAFAEAAASLGVTVPTAIYEGLVGMATPERGALLRQRYGTNFPWAALKAAADAIRDARVKDGLRLKRGVLGLLRHVEARHLGMAIATSASHRNARAQVQSAGLWHRFDVVVTRDDVARGKPYPETFAVAAQRLGVTPRRCLAVEDSEPGIAAAWFAGMLPVMVTNTVTPTNTLRARSIGIVADLCHVRSLLGG